jgi:hypothetical protein
MTVNLIEVIGCEGVNSIQLTLDKPQRRALANTVKQLRGP